jgi:hypothetical protein
LGFNGNSKRFVLVGNAVEQKDGKKVIDDAKFHLFEFVHDVEKIPDVISLVAARNIFGWKGISALVTANCSVQQEHTTGRSRKSFAGKGIRNRKCYLL